MLCVLLWISILDQIPLFSEESKLLGANCLGMDFPKVPKGFEADQAMPSILLCSVL